MAKAKKATTKRGRKPGVKVGPYKKAKAPVIITSDNVDILTNHLKQVIRNKIKKLNLMLKKLK